MRTMIDSLGHAVNRGILPALIGAVLVLAFQGPGATASPDPIRQVPQEIRDAVGERVEDAGLRAQFDAALAEAQRTETALKQVNEALTGAAAPARGSAARETLLEARFAAKVAYERALNLLLPLAEAQKAANEAAQQAAVAADEAFDKARCTAEPRAEDAQVEFCARRGIEVARKGGKAPPAERP